MDKSREDFEEFSIRWDEEKEDVIAEERNFPLYTTQILNLANQNAQGTRPKVVGQMSEMIQDFDSYGEWREWYLENNSDRLDEAADKIEKMVEKMEEAINKIDRDMIEEWTEDLVIDKTAEGLISQELILQGLADKFNTDYRMAKPKEESKNIDGYLGDQPVSIKPEEDAAKDGQLASIDIEVPLIFYKTTDTFIYVYYDPEEIQPDQKN